MGELGTDAAPAGGSGQSGAERFGALLREELEAAGMPTYQSIANRGGISKSSVSDAMRGLRIPSARTVLGIMAGLDRDSEPLMLERERLQGLDAADGTDPTHAAGPVTATNSEQPVPGLGTLAAPAPHQHAGESQSNGQPLTPIEGAGHAHVPGPTRLRWRPTGKMTLVLASVLTTGIILGQFAAMATNADGAVGTHPAATGSNVLDSPCTRDGIVMASERRARDTRVEIVFSHDCQALWGRVLRNDGRAFGNAMGAVLYPKGDPASALAQVVEVQDTATALTTMVTMPEHDRQFCIEASLTVGLERVDLGDPLCL